MNCPQCQNPLSDNASVCAVCGTAREQNAFEKTHEEPVSALHEIIAQKTPVEPEKTVAPVPSITRTDRLFSLIAASVCLSRTFGVPNFSPHIRATTLFNFWAFLLGPLYYLFTGMWRKAIVIALLMVPIRFFFYVDNDNAPLRHFLSEEYGLFTLAVEILCIVFVLLYCLGRRFSAFLAATAFLGVFIFGEIHLGYLNLGISSAFAWFNSRFVWEALCSVGFFSLLARRPVDSACTLLVGLAFWQAGLPITTLPPEILPALLAVLCGMMATYDRYRLRVLHKTFWW